MSSRCNRQARVTVKFCGDGVPPWLPSRHRARPSLPARALGLAVVIPEVSGAESLAKAIQELTSERVAVTIVLQTTMLLSLRKEIAPLMAANRLPALYGYREHVDEGGLIAGRPTLEGQGVRPEAQTQQGPAVAAAVPAALAAVSAAMAESAMAKTAMEGLGGSSGGSQQREGKRSANQAFHRPCTPEQRC